MQIWRAQRSFRILRTHRRVARIPLWVQTAKKRIFTTENTKVKRKSLTEDFFVFSVFSVFSVFFVVKQFAI